MRLSPPLHPRVRPRARTGRALLVVLVVLLPLVVAGCGSDVDEDRAAEQLRGELAALPGVGEVDLSQSRDVTAGHRNDFTVAVSPGLDAEALADRIDDVRRLGRGAGLDVFAITLRLRSPETPPSVELVVDEESVDTALDTAAVADLMLSAAKGDLAGHLHRLDLTPLTAVVVPASDRAVAPILESVVRRGSANVVRRWLVRSADGALDDIEIDGAPLDAGTVALVRGTEQALAAHPDLAQFSELAVGEDRPVLTVHLSHARDVSHADYGRDDRPELWPMLRALVDAAQDAGPSLLRVRRTGSTDPGPDAEGIVLLEVDGTEVATDPRSLGWDEAARAHLARRG
ncbi:hypothetical protein JK386_01135 [Nocardioides sp. zg-536]|uniref:Uncharacterized protein n=1 Tax=Nocardioides faecalis TaxID=2803858 RepID=A0A938Y594_9ACTN|nr:hypothetical protein [Nocardioides faecalis]MBM9458498.1 hypothetical protein [Nocardioides faecalis]QVI58508.1 hypothetical protein KG111_16225 [Nocardioides faecalis]